jgi:hypothetical protein
MGDLYRSLGTKYFCGTRGKTRNSLFSFGNTEFTNPVGATVLINIWNLTRGGFIFSHEVPGRPGNI